MNPSEYHAKSPSIRTGRLATLRGLLRAKGSGALPARLALPLALLVATLLTLASAAPASAAGVHRFKEAFGGATPPTFTTPASIAVEQSSGDVLVLDAGKAEEDSLKVAATAGQFRIMYEGRTTTATATGETTSGSKVVKNLSGVTGTFTRGEAISGSTGIPAAATVAKIISATEVEISAAANATATGVSLTAEGLPFNITAANLKAALEDLSGLPAPAIAVTGGPGNATGSAPYTIKFLYRNAAPLSVANGTVPLSGGSPSSEAKVETKVEGVSAAIKRFRPNGTPDNFSGLGTNEIDGQRGPGGKTRSECESAPEHASCDETPQNGLAPAAQETNVFSQSQIAVDNSSGPNAGDIYLTQSSRHLVSVFSPGGAYLTQITEYEPDEAQEVSFMPVNTWTGASTFMLGNLPAACLQPSTGAVSRGETALQIAGNVLAALESACGPNFRVAGNGIKGFIIEFTDALSNAVQPPLTCTHLSGPGTSCPVTTTVPGHSPRLALGESRGIAVDSTGAFYIGTELTIDKYSPTASPPLNSDSSINFGSLIAAQTKEAGAGICNLAVGTVSTAGAIFAAKCGSGAVEKRDSTTGAVAYSFGAGRLVAVDPETGNPIVAPASAVASEYETGVAAPTEARSTLTAGGTIQGIAFSKAGGDLYVSRSGSTTLEIFGPVVHQATVSLFAASEVSTTKGTLNGSVDAEGTPITSCRFEYLTEAEYTANGNSFSGADTPQSAACAESVPVDGSAHPVSAVVSGLKAETSYRYRLVAENGAGPTTSAVVKTFTTSTTVTTGQATAVTATTATLSGTVNSVGLQYTACRFEYLTQADYAFDGNSYSGAKAPQIANCNPAAASIEPDFQAHTVSAALTGLAKNTTYHFRLSATNASGTIVGADQTLETIGQPQIVNEAAFVGRTGATLKAWIDPSGFPTTYRFEWGAGSSYSNRIPAETDLFVGSGTEPVEVSAQLSGLVEQAEYHFRVVADSISGEAEGEDRRFVTLNSNGLPDGRGFELVSPADKRPNGTVGSISVGDEGQLLTQASQDGNAIVYPLLNGLETSTAGGFLRELGERTGSSWQSTQISSPSLVSPTERNISTSLENPGLVLWASPDLGCAIVKTYNPLTADTPKVDVELGVQNLYRWNRDTDSYTLITDQVPLNPEATAGAAAAYSQIEASEDCSRIYFKSNTYDFIEGGSTLYEWDEGHLSDAGVLPDGTPGPGADFGGETIEGESPRWNAVSPDGSRAFFSAVSDEGPDAGTRAIFMREDGGARVTDISQSQMAVPTDGAAFEAASEDGSDVFFRANYGIAGISGSGATNGSCGASKAQVVVETTRCDLYDYDVASGELTDISADSNPADTNGATVQGLVAISPDGSHVYFAATGQLVPGLGKTYAANNNGLGSANIYLVEDGGLSYVTNLGGLQVTTESGGSGEVSDLTGANKGDAGVQFAPGGASGGALMSFPQLWSASTTGDGESLLFQAAGDVTGYQSGGDQEAYLFTAGDGRVVCISCRPDGRPSVRLPSPYEFGASEVTLSPPLPILQKYQDPAFSDYHPRSISESGKRVVFTSPDVLASGGVAGKSNVYEWEEGQIYFLALAKPSGGSGMGSFLDMSPDSDDVFVATSEQLVPQDVDFVSDVYDIRVGGGFASEPVPTPCDPVGAGCQGPAGAQPPVVASPSNAQGPGNPPSPSAKKKKPHGKRHKHRAKRHKHKAKKRHHRSPPANSDRGGAK